MVEIIEKNLIKNGLEISCRLLEENRERLNKMNYFPVADKDTGTNMAVSARKALDYLNKFEDDPDTHEIFIRYFDGLLESSRGNSGTILAMFAEGFSSAIKEDAPVTGRTLAEAMNSAAENACCAVSEIKDGTMLTVALDAAKAGLSVCDMTSDAIFIWRRICEEAHAALTNTAFRNPVLRRFGVADSGAFGMCLILDGLLLALDPNTELPPYHFCEEPIGRSDDDGTDVMPPLIFPYCTELVISKDAEHTASELEEKLKDMGDCLHCIENSEKIKLHIHTAEPLKVEEIASHFGAIVSEKIENMTDPNEKIR